MTTVTSELAFEEAIEAALLHHGPDAAPGEPELVRESPAPGGYDWS